MTHGSLFAGIGGFDLGFERAGIKTVWQVEIDPFCQRVLAKHFPEAERFEDVRTVTGLPRVDVISGGFPCQDISAAGKRVGIEGERSGLWSEMWRIICDVRPQYVVVENVSALLHRGIERVLGDLAAGGFDAEWDVLPAYAFGAPHIRERIFIVAYPNSGCCQRPKYSVRAGRNVTGISGEAMADDQSDGCGQGRPGRPDSGCARESQQALLADSEIFTIGAGLCESESGEIRRGRLGHIGSARHAWATEPDVGRVAHGIPARVDRLKGLGNAVVPQIAEWIGRRIIEAELSQGPQ